MGNLLMDNSGDDFTSNMVRFVGVERFNLAVERPAAVLYCTGCRPHDLRSERLLSANSSDECAALAGVWSQQHSRL